VINQIVTVASYAMLINNVGKHMDAFHSHNFLSILKRLVSDCVLTFQSYDQALVFPTRWTFKNNCWGSSQNSTEWDAAIQSLNC